MAHKLQQMTPGDSHEGAPTPWLASGPGFSIFLIHAYAGRVSEKGLYVDHPAPPLTAWQLTEGEGEVALAGGAWQPLPLGKWVLFPLVPRRQRLPETAHLRSVRWRFEGPMPRGFRELIVCDAEASAHLSERASALIGLVERQFGADAGRIRLPDTLREDSLPARMRFAGELLRWAEAWTDVLHTHVGDSPPREPIDPRIEQAFNALVARPLDQRLDEAKVAREVGLSRAHFKRLFHAAYGESARQVRERTRAHAATALLRETTQPVKSIAAATGFASHAAFTQWFARTLGLTPQQFRANLRHEA